VCSIVICGTHESNDKRSEAAADHKADNETD